MEVPREVFDREVEWPEPRKDLPVEQEDHPDSIPDTPEGPFSRLFDQDEDRDRRRDE